MSSEAAAGDVAVERKWPVVVKLRHPVDLGSERIAALEFRRGRLGDLKGMKVDGVPPADHLMLIASRLSGQPVKVIEMLDADDAGEVTDIALDFFARCLAAGKTP